MKKIIFFLIVIFSCIIFFKKEDEVFVEKRGIFFSYIELSKYISSDIESSMNNINSIIENIKRDKFNLIILQVRSFSDAIYKSDIFPWSSLLSGTEGVDVGFDVLEYFVDKCQENDIEIYAWINPYRVRSSNDILSISERNPAYKFLNTSHIIISDGIYYNPSSDKVIELIVDGVEEVILNYDIDGVLFDDYFYPCIDCDYGDYLNLDADISYDEYKFMRVNKLIMSVYDVCNKHDVLFGVSPDGNIENNYNKLYADVKKWLSNEGYIDFIMPQIYYGFFNESKAFKKVIDEWESLVINKDIDLIIALAFYKNGTYDRWARSGEYEWVNNSDIIMREIVLSRNLKNYGGFSLFRYDHLYNDSLFTKNTLLEIENMKKVLK